MFKLNSKGFAHWAIPVAVVVLVGAIGTYTLTKSHAAALYPTAANCGSGYTKAVSYGFIAKGTTSFPSRVDVYYNSALKRACAFNIATGAANGGAKKPMSISIALHTNEAPITTVSGNAAESSSKGSFTRWAGPVYVNYGSALTKYRQAGGVSIYTAAQTTYNNQYGYSNNTTKIATYMY